MAQGFSLKDQLFNAEKVAYLGGLFGAADAGFDVAEFQRRVMSRMLELELKARIDWIAEVLDEMLPAHFEVAADLIERAMPPPLDPTLSDDDFGDFIFSPLGEFAVRRGLKDHAPRALDLMEQLTQRFSTEFSIRPFLNHWPEETYARLRDWAKHPSYHVRRLASEGTRPKLPWGMKITTAFEDALPLLDQLHADKTRFVTRSVANHLNDIAKFDADAVLARLAKWRKAAKQDAKELDWMTRHALRTLIKQGHPEALLMLGYRADAPVEAALSLAKDTLKFGDKISFNITLESEIDVPVLVDFVIYFRKSNGSTAPKVFKLKQAKLAAGEPLTIKKAHHLKADATTFKLHAGAHRIGVQVNGRVLAEADFLLHEA